MTIRSTFGKDRYLSGDEDVTIRPKLWVGDSTKPGVIFIHGANATAAQGWNGETNPGIVKLLAAVVEAGYPVMAIDAASTGTANKWANDTALAAVGSAVTYMSAMVGAKLNKVFLFGFSMGGLTALAYAAANPSKAAGVVAMNPVSNLTDFHTNNRGGYQANINAAYGGAYSEATYGAGHNPQTMAAAGSLATVPVKLFYASDDPIVPAATVTTLQATIGSGATITNVGALGHTDAAIAAIDKPSIVAFLKANS